ncbi:MAG: FHA domain-containing protein [Acidobacteriota bacterium]
MIVSCPTCGAKYQYDESRFGTASSKRLKCSKCEGVFEVLKPAGLPAVDGPVSRTVVSAGLRVETEHAAEHEGDSSGEVNAFADLAPLSSDRRYSLAVILGASAGKIFQINQPRLVIGRGAGTDVQLQDSEISRRHAMIEIQEDEAVLVDLGSTNGTFVGGAKIDRSPLENQGEFTIGNTTLMFIVTQMHEVG